MRKPTAAAHPTPAPAASPEELRKKLREVSGQLLFMHEYIRDAVYGDDSCRKLAAAASAEIAKEGIALAKGALAEGQSSSTPLTERVKLEEIKHDADKQKVFIGRKCLIWAGDGNAYWLANGCGYGGKSDAGIYDFDDAFDHSRHCGPEKHIEYHFLAEGQSSSTPERCVTNLSQQDYDNLVRDAMKWRKQSIDADRAQRGDEQGERE